MVALQPALENLDLRCGPFEARQKVHFDHFEDSRISTIARAHRTALYSLLSRLEEHPKS